MSSRIESLLSRITPPFFIITALVGLYLVLLPAPLVIQTSEAGGDVYFSANRRIVVWTNTCVIVRWDVQNIETVYFNGQPQVGSGSIADCHVGDMLPTLKVVFRDKTEHSYRLDILILAEDPIAWIILAIGAVLAFRFFLISDLRLRAVKRMVLLTAIVMILYWQASSLTETIATAKWLPASQALASLLGWAAFGLMIIVPAAKIMRQDQPDEQNTHFRRAIIGWGIGVCLGMIVTAAVVIYINPRGYYPTHYFEPHELLLRGVKTQGYATLNETPDLVVMGSSRAFTIAPAYIQEKLGHSAYNMAIEGSRIEDVLIQTRFMLNQRDHKLPKVLLIEVQEGLPRESNDIAERAPLDLLPYMRFDTAQLTLQRRLEGLFDFRHLAEAVYIWRYYDIYKRQPKEWPFFAADGAASRPTVNASALEQTIQLDIGNIPPERCTEVNAVSKLEMEELIGKTEEQGSALVFYISPWNPRYYNAVLGDDAQYQHCREISRAYMDDLTSTHHHLFFLDYGLLTSIKGVETEAGYYDSQHLTAANANRLIDAAAPTLERAFASATH